MDGGGDYVEVWTNAYTLTGDDPAGGFSSCVNLAKTNLLRALINPDNYRVFAEMSMSPSTSWRAPPKAKESQSSTTSQATQT